MILKVYCEITKPRQNSWGGNTGEEDVIRELAAEIESYVSSRDSVIQIFKDMFLINGRTFSDNSKNGGTVEITYQPGPKNKTEAKRVWYINL